MPSLQFCLTLDILFPLCINKTFAIKTHPSCLLPIHSSAPCELASTLTIPLHLLFVKLLRNSSAIHCTFSVLILLGFFAALYVAAHSHTWKVPYPECLPQCTWVFLLYHQPFLFSLLGWPLNLLPVLQCQRTLELNASISSTVCVYQFPNVILCIALALDSYQL